MVELPPEFAAMIESVILRAVSSARRALVIESRVFAESRRRFTTSAIRIESACESTGFGFGAGAPAGTAAAVVAVTGFDFFAAVSSTTTCFFALAGGADFARVIA